MAARVTTLARANRRRILALEAAIAASIGAAYASAQRDMQMSIDTFTDDYAAAADDYGDGDVPVSWLQTSGQLPALQHRTSASIEVFATATLFALLHGQRQAAHNGAEDATALIATALTPIMPTLQAFAFPRHVTGDVLAAFVGKSQTTGNPLSRLLDQLGPVTAQRVTKVLYGALASGSHPSVAARMLTNVTDMAYRRALTISRTEMLGAYRAANIATYQANSDVLQGWRWLASATACPFCQEMNGTEHSLDEMMESHPNCACVPVAISRPFAAILSTFAA